MCNLFGIKSKIEMIKYEILSHIQRETFIPMILLIYCITKYIFRLYLV